MKNKQLYTFLANFASNNLLSLDYSIPILKFKGGVIENSKNMNK